MKRAIGWVILLALGLTGCAAAPIEPPPTPSTNPSVAVPEGGVSLRDLGFRHAPEGLSVPADARISERIDQGNNVTVVFDQPSGDELIDYFRTALPELGFTIDEDANGAMLFHRDPWQGAFTSADGISALSLRTDRES